jgi:hypothetical protein
LEFLSAADYIGASCDGCRRTLSEKDIQRQVGHFSVPELPDPVLRRFSSSLGRPG